MIKKTFEKEPYTAPQWNLRVITVERHILENSPEGNNPDDEEYNDQGDF
jgi:hypothetical protein